MKRLLVPAAAIAVGLTLGLAYYAQVDARQKAAKVAICHGTASTKNPYVMIVVDASAVKGHFDGTAPGHGKNNAPDFLLGEIHTKEQEAAFRRAGDSACAVHVNPGS